MPPKKQHATKATLKGPSTPSDSELDSQKLKMNGGPPANQQGNRDDESAYESESEYTSDEDESPRPTTKGARKDSESSEYTSSEYTSSEESEYTSSEESENESESDAFPKTTQTKAHQQIQSKAAPKNKKTTKEDEDIDAFLADLDKPKSTKPQPTKAVATQPTAEGQQPQLSKAQLKRQRQKAAKAAASSEQPPQKNEKKAEKKTEQNPEKKEEKKAEEKKPTAAKKGGKAVAALKGLLYITSINLCHFERSRFNQVSTKIMPSNYNHISYKLRILLTLNILNSTANASYTAL